MAPSSAKTPAGISNEAVIAKTGRGWEEWFAELDGANATQMTHKDIARHLVTEFGIDGWWAQSVTVEYERARGMRQMHQTTDGFSSSASKTIAVPLPVLYAAWTSQERRAQWLSEQINVTKATENKSLRATSADGRTRISVGFYAKGDAKSQVSLQHEKLADADEATKSKEYWAEALDRLKSVLQP